MRRFALPFVLGLIPLCSTSSAQSLVQLTFAGEIEESGGARVRAYVSFADTGKNVGDEVRVDVDLHLAEHTSAADLADLLARYLESRGARIVHSSASSGPRTLAHLFIEDCMSVTLHLGHGLSPTITLCEAMPISLRVVPPVVKKGSGRLLVAASTLHAHTQQSGQVSFEVEMDEGRAVAMISDDIVTTSIREGWLGERVNHEIWRPAGMSDGARVLGTSIQLLSTGADWQLEVVVGPRATAR